MEIQKWLRSNPTTFINRIITDRRLFSLWIFLQVVQIFTLFCLWRLLFTFIQTADSSKPATTKAAHDQRRPGRLREGLLLRNRGKTWCRPDLDIKKYFWMRLGTSNQSSTTLPNGCRTWFRTLPIHKWWNYHFSIKYFVSKYDFVKVWCSRHPRLQAGHLGRSEARCRCLQGTSSHHTVNGRIGGPGYGSR